MGEFRTGQPKRWSLEATATSCRKPCRVRAQLRTPLSWNPSSDPLLAQGMARPACTRNLNSESGMHGNREANRKGAHRQEVAAQVEEVPQVAEVAQVEEAK